MVRPLSMSARFALILLVIAGVVQAQTQVGASQPPPPTDQKDKNAPEMATRESPALFKDRVNLVTVPVVVRDAKGHPIGTLTKADFQLFDKGKPQEITRLTVEQSPGQDANGTQAAVPGGAAASPEVADRYVAYVFDDVHLPFSDLARARDAAIIQLAVIPKNERAAIFTTSGLNQVDFTDDLDKLHEALMHLQVRSRMPSQSCPAIGDFEASLILNNYAAAIAELTQLAMDCSGMNQLQAKSLLMTTARMVQPISGHQTQLTMLTLENVVRRMSIMPGQRIMVLLSSGFHVLEDLQAKGDIIDRAIHAKVFINSLDCRGLFIPPTGIAGDAANSQADVLAELAVGTGGGFIQNNNDIEGSIHRLAAAPEYSYVLGFSPQNLKLDGAFHALKVTLKAAAGFSPQSRKGYYAPRKPVSAEEAEHQEIGQALFSRDELSELPLELHTQYFKASDKSATVTLIYRINPGAFPFRKADDRNIDRLTVVAGLFDRNGNYLSGIEKVVDLKLKDQSLARIVAAGGLTLKSSFSVPPGTYSVRVVARESEGQTMSAINGSVAIQ